MSGKSKQNILRGRFSGEMDPEMKILSYSIRYDKRLIEEDITGSLVHAGSLQEAGVLSKKELGLITLGLKKILKNHFKGQITFNADDEDIHMAVERILTEDIGSLGKKLHTGRSRNDQVATDFKMYIRKQCHLINNEIGNLQRILYLKSVEYLKLIVPGYTHLQQAQPVYFSHYLMSFFWALERDISRFKHVIEAVQELPLGSGALAGSAFNYNRSKTAALLGFAKISKNSIDATSHRDFVLEFLSSAATLGALISRYAEDFVIWSSQEFGYIEFSDYFTTGSSMMPQKKNPDSMELIRGKSGRLLGNYTAVFTSIKGVPMCYSRDLQEDKEPVFDSVDTILNVLRVKAKALSGVVLNKEVISKKLNDNMLATDLADKLVLQGIPFREAHETVAKMVAKAGVKGQTFLELPDSDWELLPGGIKMKSGLTFAKSIEKRTISGGTGLKSVKQQLSKAKAKLKSTGMIDI